MPSDKPVQSKSSDADSKQIVIRVGDIGDSSNSNESLSKSSKSEIEINETEEKGYVVEEPALKEAT